MKNWWKRFRKLMHLPLTDQLLILQTIVVLATLRIGLKLLSFHQFRHVYSRLTAIKQYRDISDKQIERRVWAIQKVSSLLSAVCLPQALALSFFLRKDKNVELIVGVRKNQAFEAHAWVEKNGIILIGELPDVGFQPLWTWH